jgi:hypothetical protein
MKENQEKPRGNIIYNPKKLEEARVVELLKKDIIPHKAGDLEQARKLDLESKGIPFYSAENPQLARVFDLKFKKVAHYSPEDAKSARRAELMAKIESYSNQLEHYSKLQNPTEDQQKEIEEAERVIREARVQFVNIPVKSFLTAKNESKQMERTADSSVKSEKYMIVKRIFENNGSLEIFESALKLHSLTDLNPSEGATFAGEAKEIVDSNFKNDVFILAWKLIKALRMKDEER